MKFIINFFCLQAIMTLLSKRLPNSSSSFRRMMSSAITLLCVHTKSPQPRAEWIMNKLLS